MVDMPEKQKRHRVCHINRLKPWHTPTADVLYCNLLPDESLEASTDVPTWREGDDPPTISPHLSAEQRQQLLELLHEHAHVMSDLPGKTAIISHKIHADSASPIAVPPRRIPQAYRDTAIQEIKAIIEPSTSPWRFPLVFVTKKDGSLCLCVDYCQLNARSTTDTYPMPCADDLLDRVGNAKFITTLELTKGYYQVPMDEESKKLTAFATPIGLYQFKVMPFSLKGAPATFQRLMDQVLRGLESADAYIDDIEINSPDWESHIRHLREVFARLAEAGLTARPKKCHFAMP